MGSEGKSGMLTLPGAALVVGFGAGFGGGGTGVGAIILSSAGTGGGTGTGAGAGTVGLVAIAGAGLAGGVEVLGGFDSEGLDAVLAEDGAAFGATVFCGVTAFLGSALTGLPAGADAFAAFLVGLPAGDAFLGADFLTMGLALVFFLGAGLEGFGRGFLIADLGVGLFDFALFDALLLTFQLLLC